MHRQKAFTFFERHRAISLLASELTAAHACKQDSAAPQLVMRKGYLGYAKARLRKRHLG
mgnify:CR=1 FL=1